MSKYKLYTILIKAQLGRDEETTDLVMMAVSTFATNAKQAKRDGVFLALDMWPVKEGWGGHVCSSHEIEQSWYRMRKVKRSESFRDNIKGGTDGEFSLVEELADVKHNAWCGWIRYMFSTGDDLNSDGSFTIKPEQVERWQRQMITPYSELHESEKESDRVEARLIIDAL